VDAEDDGAGVGETEAGELLGLTVPLDELGEGAGRRWWCGARAV
jgi:hypothetical protein